MTDRQDLVRTAFTALDAGDIAPFRALLDPDAEWVAVPQGRETPTCGNRAAIVRRLEHLHRDGRQFRLGKLIEDRDRIAVEVTVLAPEWGGPVTLFRVFTFAPGEDVVVRLNDCIDESYALQVLAA
jgi:SnoaL-like domain